MGTRLDVVVGHEFYWVAFALPGIYLAMVSVLPTDVVTVRIFTVGLFALCILLAVLAGASFSVTGNPVDAAHCAISLLMAIALAPTLRFRTCPPRAALRRLWLV